MANFDLRKEVSQMISRAIDSSVNYSGKEYDLNRHNWVQITTDRVIAAVMQSLPEPIDIKTKYETDQVGGIYVNIGADESPEHNERQLEHLAIYQSDQGWNHFFITYTDYLRGLYILPESMIQSKNEEHRDESGGQNPISKSGFEPKDSDESDNQEPSKVR